MTDGPPMPMNAPRSGIPVPDNHAQRMTQDEMATELAAQRIECRFRSVCGYDWALLGITSHGAVLMSVSVV